MSPPQTKRYGHSLAAKSPAAGGWGLLGGAGDHRGRVNRLTSWAAGPIHLRQNQCLANCRDGCAVRAEGLGKSRAPRERAGQEQASKGHWRVRQAALAALLATARCPACPPPSTRRLWEKRARNAGSGGKQVWLSTHPDVDTLHRHALGLRQEESHEEGHQAHPAGEEDEHAPPASRAKARRVGEVEQAP